VRDCASPPQYKKKERGAAYFAYRLCAVKVILSTAHFILSSCHLYTHAHTLLARSLLDLLMALLPQLPSAGDGAPEFVQVFRTLSEAPERKRYLAARGALRILVDLIEREVATITALEGGTEVDAAQGLNNGWRHGGVGLFQLLQQRGKRSNNR